MDDRIYFHQYRRPRYNNPTYVSNNVNSSLVFFDQKAYQGNPSFNSYDAYNQSRSSYNAEQSKSLNKMNSLVQNNSPYTANMNPQHDQPNIRNQSRGNSQGIRNYPSNLSAYGSTSLSLNQNDIYNKQNGKFNIITMKPKQFDTSIRQYPKYTLQNKDQLYYKRMSQQLQKKRQYEEQDNKKRYMNNSGFQKEQFIAGKHTYHVDREKNANHQQHINSEYGHTGNSYIPTQNRQIKQFTPKMLNHMDQLSSLS